MNIPQPICLAEEVPSSIPPCRERGPMPKKPNKATEDTACKVLCSSCPPHLLASRPLDNKEP